MQYLVIDMSNQGISHMHYFHIDTVNYKTKNTLIYTFGVTMDILYRFRQVITDTTSTFIISLQYARDRLSAIH